MERKNPFERQSFSYQEFCTDFRVQRIERSYEKIGTPSLGALIVYVLLMITISAISYHLNEVLHFFSGLYTYLSLEFSSWINNPNPQLIEIRPAFQNAVSPPSIAQYEEASYLPTLITGIATFGFALLFFVAEFMRDKGSHPSSKVVIQKTLIFPLVVSCITAFLIFAFIPHHPYSLGIALGVYLGGMALIGVWQLFNWIWVRYKPAEGGDIPAAKAVYRLFLYEINLSNKRFAFTKKFAAWQLQKMKDECEQSLEEFVEGVLNYQSPHDEDYMANIGRILVRIRYILDDNEFIKNKFTGIPKLVLPYLQKLMFNDNEIAKLVSKGKKWIRRAAYQGIINAELALEVGDKNSMSYSLQLVAALYGLLNPDKKLRDEFLERICLWFNEFSAYYLEPKLFRLPKHITEHQEVTNLSEVLFDMFSSLIYRTFESGVAEGSDKNFRYVLSSYAQLFDDYLTGGFSAKRDIEHEAEGAEFWLQNPENAPKKPEEYMLDIEINKARLGLLESQKSLLACIGAIIFYDMNSKYKGREEVIDHYFRHIYSQLVISLESLLPLYLEMPDSADDKWDLDIFTRTQSTSVKPQVHAVPNVIYDLLPPALLYVLLSTPSAFIPPALESVEIKGKHAYRLEKLIELLEKCGSENSPHWYSRIDETARGKIAPLLSLLRTLRESAKDKEKDEVRQTPLPISAPELFKKRVMEGYKKSSAIITILKILGADIQIAIHRKYQGKRPRIGFTNSNAKSTMLSEGQLETVGKMYGERFAEEEGRFVLESIIKNVPKEEFSLSKTLEAIGKTDNQNCVLCTSHWYWFDAILQSPIVQKIFLQVDPKKDQSLIEQYGSIFRGHLLLGEKKYPVIAFHQSALDGKLLLLQRNKIGCLTYLSAEPHGEPQKDATTSPLYIRFVAFSENENELNIALKSKKTLPDIKGKEEKKKKLQEIVFTEVLFRFEFEPIKDGIKVYKLGLKGRLTPRRKRRKK